MVGGDPAIDHAASMEEEKNFTLAKRDIVSMVASIFAVVEPKDIRLQVHGCAHCSICSVLVMLIDEHLPEATVHIERIQLGLVGIERMQGKNVFRVLQANTVLFELEGDDEYCFFEDLMQLLHMECGRVCPRASSILVALRDGEVSPQACIKLRYAIKVFTLAGRLLTRFDMLFAATVRDLLLVVHEDCVYNGNVLDCIVLPAFRQRSPALEQRFPEHKASLHTSSEISLDTLLMELGASVKVDCENIISVYRML